jgi:Protein of unknown function (DUF2934)
MPIHIQGQACARPSGHGPALTRPCKLLAVELWGLRWNLSASGSGSAALSSTLPQPPLALRERETAKMKSENEQGTTMIDDEQEIRIQAHKLWLEEGCPEGRAERHWTEAKEIVALRAVFAHTLRPVAETVADPVEPTLAVENQADMPGLDDLGNSQPAPSWNLAREIADVRPLGSATSSHQSTGGSTVRAKPV